MNSIYFVLLSFFPGVFAFFAACVKSRRAFLPSMIFQMLAIQRAHIYLVISKSKHRFEFAGMYQPVKEAGSVAVVCERERENDENMQCSRQFARKSEWRFDCCIEKRTTTLGTLCLCAIAEMRRHVNLGVLADLHRKGAQGPALDQILARREFERSCVEMCRQG